MKLYVVETLTADFWLKDAITFTKLNPARARLRGLMKADQRVFERKQKGQPAPLRKKDCYRIVKTNPSLGGDFVPEVV